MKKAIVVAIGVMGFAGSATAQAPVAVVEEVQGNVTGAEFMDYVVPGKVIKLGQGASIVVGYMKSCRRETINGTGTVIVGEDESMVHLAEVEATRTNCDPAQVHATTRATSDVAASVVRSLGKGASPAGPPLTLYGTSPLVEAKGRGTLVFERLDQKGERQQFDLSGNQLKGRFYDLAGTANSLTPGATYAATFASRRVVFRIDPQAKAGPTPIVGRLLRME
ncbi:MAG: hypothetical protein Q7J60_08670 [Bradyrhizobium sp.]|uniref:hypothetical protein n=1 Tax=Bradyrhizobium sp. TaxID=376 RepID=UPI002728ADDB|nr:hypothetical protein [Bradyrhizobium sp.]MDO9561679.1 hypothetical protein [Bradyrhizobium sp.]MDP3690781.1 hypothetical protein [Bradyrhizobium sp.]